MDTTFPVREGQLTLEEVMAKAHRYHPHMLVELLQRLTSNKVPVHIRPSDSLAFPAADVADVRKTEQGNLDLQVRFDGFYGVDAPLPHYFLEDATVDSDAAERIRSFLDLFNHSFYQLHHQAWQHFRFYSRPQGGLDLLSRILQSILPGNLEASHEARCYPGVFIQGQPSKRSLAALLRNLLDAPQLQLEAQACRWQTLSQKSVLGQSLKLNHNLVLGSRLPVMGQRVLIQLGRISQEKAEQLYPGTDLSTSMARILNKALTEDSDWTLEFQVQPDPKRRQLGQKHLALGRSCTLTGATDTWIKQAYVSSQYSHILRSTH